MGKYTPITGLQILAISTSLCTDCLKQWNKMLNGEIETFEPCKLCNEKIKKVSDVT